MSRHHTKSKCAGAAGLPAISLIEDISYELSYLDSLQRSTNERTTWWFLPEDLPLPCQGRKLSRTPGVTPKPRTAYELFRAHIGQTVLPAEIPFCTKQVSVSRIASYVWQRLPAHKLALFDNLFQEEQRLHQRWYPDYVIQDRCTTPTSRSKAKPVEGDEDAMKCKKIAELLLANIQRDELAFLIHQIVSSGPQPGCLKIAPAPTSRLYAS